MQLQKKIKIVYISQISSNSTRLLDWENRVGVKGMGVEEIGEAERAKQSKTGNFTGEVGVICMRKEGEKTPKIILEMVNAELIVCK